MTVQETNLFLKRIKQYYNDFIIDDFKVEEWYKQLKDYDVQDINNRLDKHLKSETYGDYPPKLNYIVMGLTKAKDKGVIKEYFVICNNCGETLNYNDYEEHYRKCSAVDYVIREIKKYSNKEVTRKQLLDLDDKAFWNKYDALLELIKSRLPDNDGKKKLIQAYFEEIDLSIDEIKSMIN